MRLSGPTSMRPIDETLSLFQDGLITIGCTISGTDFRPQTIIILALVCPSAVRASVRLYANIVPVPFSSDPVGSALFQFQIWTPYGCELCSVYVCDVAVLQWRHLPRAHGSEPHRGPFKRLLLQKIIYTDGVPVYVHAAVDTQSTVRWSRWLQY